MKKALKLSCALVAMLLVGAQFVRPERVNPALGDERSIESHVHLDAQVEAILRRSCMDCHSNRTQWPWYSNVAPVSWFVADHINHGRRHLNFSDWTQYDEAKASRLLSDICREAKQGLMPLLSYTLIHRGAKLSDGDVTALCNWSQQERQRLVSARS